MAMLCERLAYQRKKINTPDCCSANRIVTRRPQLKIKKGGNPCPTLFRMLGILSYIKMAHIRSSLKPGRLYSPPSAHTLSLFQLVANIVTITEDADEGWLLRPKLPI